MNYKFERNDSGIVLDYFENSFYINIYDDEFNVYEKNALKHNKITVYFKNFHQVSMMMINIENCTDTSDMPFSVFDITDEEFINSLNDDNKLYEIKVNYVTTSGELLMSKSITPSKLWCRALKKELKNAFDIEYDEDAFNSELERVYTKYQPFEIEELCKDELIFTK